MNSFNQSWTRLTAAAREATAAEVVLAPDGAWLTRVAALGRAEVGAGTGSAGWLAWAMPGFGVALLIAVAAVLTLGSPLASPQGTAELIALADPLSGNAFAP
jgi:hypothetical protein